MSAVTWLRRPRRAPNPDGRMPVISHLRELRRRLIVVMLILMAGGIVGYLLYPPILHFLEHPYCSVPADKRFPGTKDSQCVLVYTGVLDGFTTRLKVSVISGAVLTSPLWLYQVWAFITPGLRKSERKYTVIFVALSTVLFAAGASLAYLVLYKGLNVLISAAGSGTAALLTANSYLSFVTLMLVIFGAAFELPLLVVMANLVGVLPARLLKKSQRLGIFLIFLFAAIATPSTDPFTMCAMAVPMVVLFEMAVLFALVHDKGKARRMAALTAAELPDDVPSQIDPIPGPINDDMPIQSGR
ncbi:MAG TPA: twin-arginine translocase subunit TatC [Candidatus Acidoferrum sp.]|nr:twin-arginine translocase subunit TatC [Candidatus Acidoferrum sp.]